MPSTHSRRRLLSAASSIGLVALAGCSGGTDDPEESDDQAPDDDAGDGPDNESDGGDESTGDDQSTPPEPVDWTDEERGTVSVGPDGDTRFEPDAVRIRPGTTVRWLWEDDGHNVVPVDQPVGGDWAGEQGIENEGHSYEFTFETLGTYEYVCEPHEAQEMRGYVVVTDD